MTRTSKTTLLMLLAAGALAILAVGCNDSTDDPQVSDTIVLTVSANPLNACADVDGELTDTDGDGTLDTAVYYPWQQTFTFKPYVRGPGTTSSIWNDVIIESAQVTYTMEDGGATPPPQTWRPTGPIHVPVGGQAGAAVETVRVSDIAGPGATLTTAGRNGSIHLAFRGRDASGEATQLCTATVPLTTANICSR